MCVFLLSGHLCSILVFTVKVMLHETILNHDFLRNTALQHCCKIVSSSYNIVLTLQSCVALKIVFANRHLYLYSCLFS